VGKLTVLKNYMTLLPDENEQNVAEKPVKSKTKSIISVTKGLRNQASSVRLVFFQI